MKNKDQNESSQVWSGTGLPRLPFEAALEAAKRQINVEAIEIEYRPFAMELIANIAEMYMMADSLPVRINGEQLDAWTVKQIFSRITEDHVRNVIASYCRVPYKIRSKKSYIRTALYNSVFELEASTLNLYASTQGR